jgi:hypothetical protein
MYSHITAVLGCLIDSVEGYMKENKHKPDRCQLCLDLETARIALRSLERKK